MEPFVVKHYASDQRPTIKGNGFDGLEVGEDREEAEEFIAWVNKLIESIQRASPNTEHHSNSGSSVNRLLIHAAAVGK